MYTCMTVGYVWVCTQRVRMWTGSRRDSQEAGAVSRGEAAAVLERTVPLRTGKLRPKLNKYRKRPLVRSFVVRSFVVQHSTQLNSTQLNKGGRGGRQPPQPVVVLVHDTDGHWGTARRVPRRSGAPPLGGRGSRGGLRSLRARPERESHATRVGGGAATPGPFPARTRDGHACVRPRPVRRRLHLRPRPPGSLCLR